TGGSFIMVATSEPFVPVPNEQGFTPPFAYTWVGEGSLEFSRGGDEEKRESRLAIRQPAPRPGRAACGGSAAALDGTFQPVVALREPGCSGPGRAALPQGAALWPAPRPVTLNGCPGGVAAGPNT